MDDFKRSVNRILNGNLNNISKNFFLEQMLRTLPSENKLMKMNMSNFSGYDGTRECTVCGVLSDSSHLLAYCIFPTYALYALNNLEVWKSKFPNLSLNQLHLEFQTSIHKDSSLIAQLDLLFIKTKTMGFNHK